jgi:hypothetical protein
MADETPHPNDALALGAAVAPIGVSDGEGGQKKATEAAEHIDALMPSKPGTGLSVSLTEVVREGLGGGRLGQAGMALLQVSTAHLERDNDRLRNERDAVGDSLAKCTQNLAAARQRSAVLRERLITARRQKWFHDAIPAVGGVLVTLAAPDVVSDAGLDSTAVVFSVIGLALIAHRLFLPAPNPDVEVE